MCSPAQRGCEQSMFPRDRHEVTGTVCGTQAEAAAMFLALFVLTGIGNGSTYRMIPSIFRAQKLSEAEGQGETGRALALKAAGVEAGAALGFIGAVGSVGGFLIPRGFGASIAATGGPYLALEIFLLFDITCIALTWWYYLRKTSSPKRACEHEHQPLATTARSGSDCNCASLLADLN